MWRVQVWKDNHIVEAELCETEESAKAKEEELRDRYNTSDFEFKTEEVKDSILFSGSLDKGVISSGGPYNQVPYDMSGVGGSSKGDSHQEQGNADSVI